MNNNTLDSKSGTSIRRVKLAECLQEVSRGVGSSWTKYRVIGATRSGLAPAKESVGKSPERYKLVEPGTIFYNPMRILLGSIAIVDEGHEPGITSPDYVAFTTRPGMVHPRWLYYWLRSQDGADFIRTLTRGAVRERMLFRRLAVAEIALPSYDAQAEFAQQVLAVERARAAAEAQLEAAKALPAASLRAVFNSPEAKQWPKKRLGDLLVAPLKTGISKSTVFDAQKQCLTLSAVRNGKLDLSASKPVEVSDREAEGNWVKPGAYYVVRGNGNRSLVGRGAIAPQTLIRPFLYPDLLIEVNLDSRSIEEDFFGLIWNSEEIRNDIESRARTSAGIYKINQGNLQEIKVSVPPPSDQKRIAARLSAQMADAERTRQALEAQLATINALPAALLCRAFNGEL